MSASQRGVVGGGVLLAMLAGFARCADNCAMVGVRGARVVDDAAGGLGGVGRAGRGAGGVAEEAAPRSPGHSLGKEAAEFGVDVAIEAAQIDSESEAVGGVTGETRCPRIVELGAASEWEALLAGFGVACAPIVVIGLTRGRGRMVLRGADVSVTELVGACAGVGARCVFVGCGDALCLAATRASMSATRLQPRLGEYVGEFVGRVLAQGAPPMFVDRLAVIDGSARTTPQ